MSEDKSAESAVERYRNAPRVPFTARSGTVYWRVRDDVADAAIAALTKERDEAMEENRALMLDWQKRQDQYEAALKWLAATEQALFAANCMLRDLGVHPATLERP